MTEPGGWTMTCSGQGHLWFVIGLRKKQRYLSLFSMLTSAGPDILIHLSHRQDLVSPLWADMSAV